MVTDGVNPTLNQIDILSHFTSCKDAVFGITVQAENPLNSGPRGI